MRNTILTDEFNAFYDALPSKAKAKMDYAMDVLAKITVVNTKLAKKLVGTDFYELRVSVDNEYRVILFTMDHENIIEARHVIFLNGFVKKATKDYKRQIEIAEEIIKNLAL